MQVINFILQTMDPSNLVMRKTCLHSSMATLKEVARVLPMVALNETSTRLAIGDAIGEINNASIRVYDMQRYAILYHLLLKQHSLRIPRKVKIIKISIFEYKSSGFG